MQCINCGGTMIGDGYSSVLRCEFSDEEDYEYVEPDASPIFCNFPNELSVKEDNSFEISGKNKEIIIVNNGLINVPEALKDLTDVTVAAKESIEGFAYALNPYYQMALDQMPSLRLKRPKKKTVCLLPGCDNLTDHNKGYCSAICFKKSKEK